MVEPFSKEIPTLLNDHLGHLQASSISLDVIRERGYSSVMGKTALKESGFSKAQQRATGILIPLHGVDGKIVGHQYRPDNPRIGKDGKLLKYENPYNSSVRLDVPPRCQGQLGNPNIPVWFTEGIKKVDSLASHGACAVGLTGVWGFKGKNPLGGTTILSDFDYITLKDRIAYLVFDSDIISKNQVRQALDRLSEHLTRKGAKTRIIKLPEGPEGTKNGVDDYIAQGHTLEDLIALEVVDQQSLKQTLRESSAEVYCIESGRICWIKQTNNGSVTVPLCNFTARVTEDILKDDGQESARFFKLLGLLGSGDNLPPVEISASSFNSMNWVASEWGMKAIIAAGQTIKDRLREAIQLQSQEAEQRMIYTHTGWRERDGKHIFLTAAGAIGAEGVEVELDPPLKRYILLPPAGDSVEVIKASFNFLLTGELKVTLPLWTAMYLAPLSEFIDPAFTLWYVGTTGSFKSVITALALCHFGDFDYLHLPAAWRDTRNQLEKLLFLAKDIPLVIDDWAPGQDSTKARELEVKAEHIVRAQGNRQGKGRMRADTSLRMSYIPRGLLITSGEQLPGGHSHTSRIVAVEIEREDIYRDILSDAQKQARLYNSAMANYIAWIAANWDRFKAELPDMWVNWRDEVYQERQHPRLPSDIASLYAGLYMGTQFAFESGAVTEKEAAALRADGWDIFMDMVNVQSGRIEDERPGQRFMEALRTLFDQGKAVLWNKDDESPRTPVPGTIPIGWADNYGYILLNPGAAYAAVHDYCQHSGEPFTFKQQAVWKDLSRQGLSTIGTNGHNTAVVWIYGKSKRVVRINRSVLDIKLDIEDKKI